MSAAPRIVFLALVIAQAAPLGAQSTPPRDAAFGFSAVTYLMEPSDAVFTDPNDHLTPNAGFRFTKASFGDRRWGWMIDGELYLGVANRQALGLDLPNTIFGLQAFAGPVIAIGSVQLYATAGVNRTTVGESKIVEVPLLDAVQYINGGGLSQAWSDIMTARANNALGGRVVASIPRYQDISMAGMFGLAWDLGGGGGGFRLSFDYIPIFISPETRSNYRFTFSLAG